MKTKSILSRTHSMLVEAKKVIKILNEVLKDARGTIQAGALIILLVSSTAHEIHAEWKKPIGAATFAASIYSGSRHL